MRVSLVRGGTSKGVFVDLDALPAEPDRRDALALALLGSPDPMQLDGLGGTHSSTSKLMAVGTPEQAAPHLAGPGRYGPADGEVDLVSLFGQVAVDRPAVDWAGNCGNLTAAVGAYALHRGLLRRSGPRTDLRLLNLNTGTRIRLSMPLVDGRLAPTGDLAIAGVPGTAAPIEVEFCDPGGTRTGSALPAGPRTGLRVRDPRTGRDTEVTATLIDVATPVVLVRATDLDVPATAPPAALNADAGLLGYLSALRRAGAEAMGFPASASVPRVAVIAEPTTHRLADGRSLSAADADLVVRMTSMDVVHHALPATGMLAVAAAAALPGTVGYLPDSAGRCRLAHPKGIARVSARPSGPASVSSVSVSRTARVLLDGEFHLPAGLA